MAAETHASDGTRYYKVRWVKYSWEPAASFTHLEHLIRDFWNQFGQNTDSLQDVGNKAIRQIASKQISLTQELPTQGVQSSQTNGATITSILTTLSSLTPIGDNITQVQSATPLQIQPSTIQIPTSFTHFTTLTAAGTPQHVEILPQIQQIPLPTSEQLQLATQGANGVSPPIKNMRDKRSRVSGDEPKKRRKIPGNCSICGKHFKSTTNIAAHKRLHTEERQYQCEECGRKFRRKLHLRRHLESHAGIKSFICNICGASFSSKWYMQAHAVIHTGDKPFQCDTCQKRFNNKANLNKHKLIHANKRPFVCNICGHSYRQSYDLKRHMSTHSEVKEHVCEQCGKTFARRTYLQRHLLTHNGEKKFNCTLCSRKFFQKGHLNFHMKQHKNKSNTITTEFENEALSTGQISGKAGVANTSVLSIMRKSNETSENSIVFASNQSQHNRTLENLTSEPISTETEKHQVIEMKELFEATMESQERTPVVHFAQQSNPSKNEPSRIIEKEGVVTVSGTVETHKHTSNHTLETQSVSTNIAAKADETYFGEQANGILEFSNSNQVVNMYL